MTGSSDVCSSDLQYSAPMIETIEVAAEKGFATSGDVPSSDGISPLSCNDDFYLGENE